jgi:hypothetical protein
LRLVEAVLRMADRLLGRASRQPPAAQQRAALLRLVEVVLRKADRLLGRASRQPPAAQQDAASLQPPSSRCA